MPLRAVIAWILAGALGLAAAAGVSLAASDLTSQRIGLEAEPLAAGDALAPSPHTTTTTTGADAQPRTATAPSAEPRAAREDDDRELHADGRRAHGREQREPDQDD